MEEIKLELFNILNNNLTKYKYLMGPNLDPLKYIEIEFITIGLNSITIAEILLMYIETEIVNNIKTHSYDLTDPLFFHDNVKYFTNDEQLYENNKEHMSFIPTLKDLICTISCKNYICSILNQLDNIHYDGFKLYFRFPIYVN